MTDKIDAVTAMIDLLAFGICAIDERGCRIDVRTLRADVNVPVNALLNGGEWHSL
jgi:hypothetical protein